MSSLIEWFTNDRLRQGQNKKKVEHLSIFKFKLKSKIKNLTWFKLDCSEFKMNFLQMLKLVLMVIRKFMYLIKIQLISKLHLLNWSDMKCTNRK